MGQFHRAAGAVAAPLWASDFDLTPEQLGSVIGVIFVAMIVTQAPMGAALDRLGTRPVLTFSIALVAVGTYGCLWASGYVGLLIARIAIGVGLASTGVGLYLILAQNFPRDQFGYLNGLKVTLGGIGGLSATYPLATLVDIHGWRPVFVGLTMGTFVLAALVLWATKSEGVSTTEQSEAVPLREILGAQGFIQILILAVVTYAPIVTITGLWGGPYFTEVHGLSLSTTGAILFVFFVATMAAGATFGLLDKRGYPRRATITVAALTSAAAFGLAAIVGSLGPWLVAALMFVAIFAQNFYIPLLAELRFVVPDAALGRATSLFSIVAVGAIPVMQTGYGAIVSRAGDAATGHMLALSAMAALIATLTLIYLITTKSR
ncbi:MAG: MFS transporter [Pseudomonadota bacterium]